MSHMPTSDQPDRPGFDAFNFETNGVPLAGNPFTTLNLTGTGFAVVDRRDGELEIGAAVGSSLVSLPYIDLRLAPYSIVANDSTKAAANRAGIDTAIAAFPDRLMRRPRPSR